MVWTIALIVFVAQLICCIWVEGKYKKYLPTLLVAAFMSVTVLNGTLGVLDVLMLVAETKVILMGILIIDLVESMLFAMQRVNLPVFYILAGWTVSMTREINNTNKKR